MNCLESWQNTLYTAQFWFVETLCGSGLCPAEIVAENFVSVCSGLFSKDLGCL